LERSHDGLSNGGLNFEKGATAIPSSRRAKAYHPVHVPCRRAWCMPTCTCRVPCVSVVARSTHLLCMRVESWESVLTSRCVVCAAPCGDGRRSTPAEGPSHNPGRNSPETPHADPSLRKTILCSIDALWRFLSGIVMKTAPEAAVRSTASR